MPERKSEGIANLSGRFSKVRFVCTRERGIVFKSAVVTRLSDWLSGGTQFFGEQ